jgi:hypothetical protein
MKAKHKPCKCGCGRSGPLWAKGMLKGCYLRLNPPAAIKRNPPEKKGCHQVIKRVPVKKISDKRAKESKIYFKLREDFLGKNPKCQLCTPLKEHLGVAAPKCNGIATEIHHTEGRTGNNYLNVSTWLASGSGCHRFITDNSSLAVQIGLSKRRNGQKMTPKMPKNTT